jgi:hypothetical protein
VFEAVQTKLLVSTTRTMVACHRQAVASPLAQIETPASITPAVVDYLKQVVVFETVLLTVQLARAHEHLIALAGIATL